MCCASIHVITIKLNTTLKIYALYEGIQKIIDNLASAFVIFLFFILFYQIRPLILLAIFIYL